MNAANELLLWLTPWEPSVLFCIVMGIAAFLYMRECRITAVRTMDKLLFWLGMGSLYFVSQTYYDYYSEHEFFMHRIQHSLLHHLAPFLIALSMPGAALVAGLPQSCKPFVQCLLNSQAMRWIAAICNSPIAAVLWFNGLIIIWLIPNIHFIAMLDWRLYRLMNWGMALNGLMFWNLVLNNFALRPAGLSPAKRIAVMLAIIPPQIIIGMLIFAAPYSLYPGYSLCGRAFGLSPLADQQIGGLILWIPAAMMSVIGILVVVKREWMDLPSAVVILRESAGSMAQRGGWMDPAVKPQDDGTR